MAKGYEINQARVGELASFGKDLARRAHSKCELCETAGVKLSAFEVPPVPALPEFDRCVFLCDRCREQTENSRRFEPGEHWRCLTQTVWSEVPAVQVLAVRLLRRQADTQAWARETLDGAFLDPEVEEWAGQE